MLGHRARLNELLRDPESATTQDVLERSTGVLRSHQTIIEQLLIGRGMQLERIADLFRSNGENAIACTSYQLAPFRPIPTP